jgi:hypothetical protein
MLAVLFLLAILGGLILPLVSSHRRWQQLTERERFFLAMKRAATPHRLLPEERSRLELLDSPWWAVWQWLRDLWHHLPPL